MSPAGGALRQTVKSHLDLDSKQLLQLPVVLRSQNRAVERRTLTCSVRDHPVRLDLTEEKLKGRDLHHLLPASAAVAPPLPGRVVCSMQKKKKSKQQQDQLQTLRSNAAGMNINNIKSFNAFHPLITVTL
ncbi:uncharacterized protein V6R79_022530 [Siganus canaliculatus]